MPEQTTLSERFAQICRWSPARFCGPRDCSWEEAEERLGACVPGPFMVVVDAVRVHGCEVEDICERKTDPGFDDWPDHLLPFFYDGMGNGYAFDTRTTTPQSDHPVVFRDAETGTEEVVVSAEETDTPFIEWAERYVAQAAADAPSSGFRSPLVAVIVMLLVCVAVVIASIGIGTVIDWLIGR